eukprot:PITA_34888
MIDEGDSMCIMSIQCWRSLSSPMLNQSPMTLKAFDGQGFHPFGIFQDLPIGVEGKTVYLDVEVVDVPLDYNLLLGRSWCYAMTTIVSSVFRLIKFHHHGKIVTIDQLNYFSSDLASSDSIQHVGKTAIPYKDVGVRLIKGSGLQGTFSFPPPNNPLQHPDSELNLGNISRTIPIDISVKPGIIENIHIGASCTDEEIQTYKALFQEFHDVFAWSYEEMPRIDPSIVVHEIKTYPDAKPVQQHLRQIHPSKAAAIKAEV